MDTRMPPLIDWLAVAHEHSTRGPRTFTKFDPSSWEPVGLSVTPIMFKDQRYPSATAALDAYICEYNGLPRGTFSSIASQDVLNLLIPPDLHLRRSASAQANKQSYETDGLSSNHGDGRNGQVYHNLAKTDRMLNDVTFDNLSSLPSETQIDLQPRKVESRETDILIHSNPYTGSSEPKKSVKPETSSHLMHSVDKAILQDYPNAQSIMDRLDSKGRTYQQYSMNQPRTRNPAIGINRSHDVSHQSYHANDTYTSAGSRTSHGQLSMGDLENSRNKNRVPYQSQSLNEIHPDRQGARGGTLSDVNNLKTSPDGAYDVQYSQKERKHLESLSSVHDPTRAAPVRSVSSSLDELLSDKKMVPQSHKHLDLHETNRGAYTSQRQTQSDPALKSAKQVRYHLGHQVGGYDRPRVDVNLSVSKMSLNSVPSETSTDRLISEVNNHMMGALNTQTMPTQGSLSKYKSAPSVQNRKIFDDSDPGANMEDESSALKASLRHQDFASQLIEEIQDTASSVVSPPKGISVPMWETGQSLSLGDLDETGDRGAGFLERVQQLLRDRDGADSRGTESILDGDRSWEQYATIKPPVHMDLEQHNSDEQLSFEERANRIVDQFKKECLQSPPEDIKKLPGLSGGKQPGTMETLKHMILKLHTVEPPSDEEENQAAGGATQGRGVSAETVGKESLERAMLHLTRLKSLMREES